MTVPKSTVKVVGLEQALKDLRKIDPQFLADLRKRSRLMANEAVVSAREEFDATSAGWSNSKYPLTGMASGTLLKGRNVVFNRAKVRRNIKFQLGGPKKSARRGKAFSMFSIIQSDAAGAIYDMAGKDGGSFNPEKQFEESLQGKDRPHRTAQPGRPNKGPSRYMWPGVWFYLPQLEDRMVELIRDLERKVNRQLIKKR